MNQKQLMPLLIVGVVMAVIGGAVGFYAARLPQFSGQATLTSGQNGGFVRGQRGTSGSTASGTPGTGRGGFAGGQNLAGKVTDITDTTMTITLNDGSSKIVTLGNSTQFETVTTETKDKVKVGDTVRVLGPTNSDGSVTAQNVMVNPPMPNASAQPSASPKAQ